jgi:hypothetical protein
MHVLSIDAKEVRFSREAGQYHATLVIKARHQRICLQVTALASSIAQEADIMRALTADALRQIRHLPEYRDGVRITISHDALKPALRSCAAPPRKAAPKQTECAHVPR